jgi:GTP-binding protein EngB required for normal cell division
MENLGNRTVISQLADDLGWLEEHCRRRPEQAVHAGQLRLAAALVRNCIGPSLNEQPPHPLHVAVVGGAGAGKSTVANLLTGATAAESNPQAGFTRHPVAYTGTNGVLNWSGHLGFLGPLQRLPHASPANLDADVYQVRRVLTDAPGFDLVKEFVIWDCPDMTTWAAMHYVPRLLEVAGLADIVVYAASDERYNDEIPTQFLNLLLQTGKPVVVCLMKMPEAAAAALVTHFQQEVLNRLPPGIVGCLAIPHLTPEQLADPARQAAKYRIPLLNQVAVLGRPPAAARRRSVRGAIAFLGANQERLLASARQDVAAMQTWRSVVQTGQVEFDARYRREFLTSEKFHRFDEALVRLLEMLELPGVGKLVGSTLWVLRTPYRLVRGWFNKAISRPESRSLPEETALKEALKGWLDLLHKEAARRAASHPLWAHVEEGFADGLGDLTRERFEQGFRAFQMAQADEIDRTARAIYEELEKNPVVLNTLRGSKLTLDVAAIIGAVAVGGHSWGLDFVLVPLAASITHQLVELLGKQYVDTQRELARQRQQALMAQYLSGPLAEWLSQWPATGGSSFERLQLALRRIPASIKELDDAVDRALQTPLEHPDRVEVG